MCKAFCQYSSHIERLYHQQRANTRLQLTAEAREIVGILKPSGAARLGGS